MEEPNLLLIKEISGDDLDFQNSILEILKKEFSEEVTLFQKNISSENYKEASNTVHKIKHKIGLLGLKRGLEIATSFEKQLKEDNIILHQDFVEILNKIHVYLYD